MSTSKENKPLGLPMDSWQQMLDPLVVAAQLHRAVIQALADAHWPGTVMEEVVKVLQEDKSLEAVEEDQAVVRRVVELLSADPQKQLDLQAVCWIAESIAFDHAYHEEDLEPAWHLTSALGDHFAYLQRQHGGGQGSDDCRS